MAKGVTRKEKKQLKKERKAEKRARRSPVVNGIFLGLKAMLITMAVICIGSLVLFYFTYGRKILELRKEAIQLVEESTADTFRSSETTLVYDANGDLLSELKGEKDSYYIEYNEIPQEAVDAMIAIEDKKFYSHHGVDFKAIARAGWALVQNRGKITEGASTITQQLSRNIFLTQEVSWERKFKEMFVAVELEKKYDKNQILEFYLNNIYFSNGYYGIEAASQGYFSKSVNQLSLSQVAFLCGIPNNPTMYDPTEHPEDTMGRRDRILKQMEEDGYITSEQCQKAQDKQIHLDLKTIKRKNYIETYVYHCATVALMESQGFEIKSEFESDSERKEYDKEYEAEYNECHQSLYSSGYRIYTSIDPKKQKKLQDSLNETLSGFTGKNEEGVYELQGAAASIDNETGKVVAIVGGRSQKSDSYTLNRAYQSFRQPGSTIKPVIVYTPAFEMDYSPDSVLCDEAIEGGPKNADLSYAGNMTLRRAVELSKNTIAWKLYDEIGPVRGVSYLTDMRFSKIMDDDYNPAVCLGGMTIGVSPVEMASAYSTIENEGVYRNPSCIVKMKDSEGNVVVRSDRKEKQVYKKNATRMMTSCLQGVMTNGTGTGVNLSGITCAGKTGTTNDLKDGWFVGYTAYYTTSVWVGYDIPKELDSLSGNTYPGKIWQAYMQSVHEGLPDKAFPYYETEGDYKNEAVKDTAPAEAPEVETEEPEKTEKPKPTEEAEPTEEPTVYDELEEPETEEPDNPDGTEPEIPENPDVDAYGPDEGDTPEDAFPEDQPTQQEAPEPEEVVPADGGMGEELPEG